MRISSGELAFLDAFNRLIAIGLSQKLRGASIALVRRVDEPLS